MNLRYVPFAASVLLLAGGLVFPTDLSAKKKKKTELPKIELKGAAKDSVEFHKKL